MVWSFAYLLVRFVRLKDAFLEDRNPLDYDNFITKFFETLENNLYNYCNKTFFPFGN